MKRSFLSKMLSVLSIIVSLVCLDGAGLSAQSIYEIYNSNGGTWTNDYIILSGFTANQSVGGRSIQYRGNTSSSW